MKNNLKEDRYVKVILVEGETLDEDVESIEVGLPDTDGGIRLVKVDAGPMYDFVVRELLSGVMR